MSYAYPNCSESNHLTKCDLGIKALGEVPQLSCPIPSYSS